ncbi:MAG TPA: hypothetical protein VKX49_20550 [Bryobacteraceae bacterium]|nr:hypothetical protein [Bryobacteraceae bacterium]
MKALPSSTEFCLYLWRSLEGPGVRYVAKSKDMARTVYTEMRAEGYIVKAVEIGSGREFELRDGDLLPARTPAGSASSAALALA